MSIREILPKLATVVVASAMIIFGTEAMIMSSPGEGAAYRLYTFLTGPGVLELIIGFALVLGGLFILSYFLVRAIKQLREVINEKPIGV